MKNISSLFIENLSNEIVTSLQVYQGNAFDAINNELRYDKQYKFKDIIKQLDNACVDSTNDILFRGLNGNFISYLANKFNVKDRNDINNWIEKIQGKSFSDKAFMSCSYDMLIAKDFATKAGKGIIMQIEGNKKGIDLRKYLTNRKALLEKEFIIKRNTKFTITKVSISKSGIIILYCTV